MIFKSGSIENVTVEKPRGGMGTMECKYAFRPNNAPDGSVFQLLASIIINPGSSIGMHEHADDEEIYVVLSGKGTFFEDNDQGAIVQEGDMLLTTKGHSHSLANAGSEPLKIIAVVAKK